MRKPWHGLVLLALLGFCAPASAVIGTIDAVPAATLLLPYFEVDVSRPDGRDTLFSINNAKAEAVLAHVTIWTDQSIPAMAFDVYLTGYDSQSISLRDIFVNGNVPVTAPAGQDPADTISPRGASSQDADFAGCSTMPYQNPFANVMMRAHLRAWLQGVQSPVTHDCAGSRQADNDVLRGYVTVDTVNACNPFFPSSWGSYAPLLTAQNVLWGDVFYVDPAQNFAQGETLVHIEACSTCFPQGRHTFYGRYNGGSGADGREALPTTMADRYVDGGIFNLNSGTSVMIWREADSWAGGYGCGRRGPQSWYPLGYTASAIFDEDEQPVVTATCPSDLGGCDVTFEIPDTAQRLGVARDLLTPFRFGWLYLNLQHGDNAYNDPYAQMWMVVRMDADGRYSVGFDALQIDNANDPVRTVIPIP